jgi:hypothetical protein
VVLVEPFDGVNGKLAPETILVCSLLPAPSKDVLVVEVESFVLLASMLDGTTLGTLGGQVFETGNDPSGRPLLHGSVEIAINPALKELLRAEALIL